MTERKTGRLSSTSVRKASKGSDLKTHNQSTEPKSVGEHPATITVKVGHTKNLGSYESLRTDVEVSLPCKPDEVEDALFRANEIAQRHARSVEDSWLNGPSEPDEDFSI